ncbi:hypothetical protein V8E53_013901 [Lactarius tabidus]
MHSNTGKRPKHATTIRELSDDILLGIFDFCRENHRLEPTRIFRFFKYPEVPEDVWDWHILVHVCQRWRQVVFASPLSLNLQILCTHGTPVRKDLDIWPNLPIQIKYFMTPKNIKAISEDNNIIAALERTDRVCVVSLRITSQQLGRMVKVMQEPFPALRHLSLSTSLPMHISNDVPALPSEFLGRSAPCLQSIDLIGIPFPALPEFLLSTSDLVTLDLCDIPQTGYIPPEAMVVGLATLTMLRSLKLGFRSPASRPDQIRIPPTTRTVLPALTSFHFHGVREYLEDFVARINSPRLDEIKITFFNQLADFEVPQLWQFIDLDSHSWELCTVPSCCIWFRKDGVTFTAGLTHDMPESFYIFPRPIHVCILCEGTDWQVSHLAQALNQDSPALRDISQLVIEANDSISPELGDMDDIDWLQLLHPFSSVYALFVSREIAGHVSRALEDIPTGMAADVLPTLQFLCLEDQSMSSAHKFIAARCESGCPVTTVDTRLAFGQAM